VQRDGRAFEAALANDGSQGRSRRVVRHRISFPTLNLLKLLFVCIVSGWQARSIVIVDDITSPAVPVFVQGMALSLGLIVAIGAQNAFVLRQGLRREHVGSVVLFCAVADAVLMAAGVLGMAQALGNRPGLARAMALAGATFLAIYGWQAVRRARQSQQLKASEGGAATHRRAVVAQAAAFTLLNPHVYLDTVLLVGSIGAQQPVTLQGWFIAGASAASLFWFGLLGYGARWLAPWFARPRAWQVLDGLIGVTMFVLAALLLRLALS
jgi:L-lysine exporter family protein LysE/ArgO